MTIYQCKLKKVCPTCKKETPCNVLFTTIEHSMFMSHIDKEHSESKFIDYEHLITHVEVVAS